MSADRNAGRTTGSRSVDRDHARASGLPISSRIPILVVVSLIVAATTAFTWHQPAAAVLIAGNVVAAAIGFNLLVVSVINGYELTVDYLTSPSRRGLRAAFGSMAFRASRLRYALPAAATVAASASVAAVGFDVDADTAFVATSPIPVAVASALLVTSRLQAQRTGPTHLIQRALIVTAAVYGAGAVSASWMVAAGDGIDTAQRFASVISLAIANVVFAHFSTIVAAVPREAPKQAQGAPEPGGGGAQDIDLGVRDLVTIITPVRRGARPEQVAAVWRSSVDGRVDLDNIRWLVIADASDDTFGERLKQALRPRLAYPTDLGRVNVLGLAEEGAGVKRNAGLDAATTDFVGFVDADDTIDASGLRHALHLLLKSGSSHSAVHLFPFELDRGQEKHERVPSRSVNSLLTHGHCSRIYPLEVFTEFGLRYRECPREDAILLLDLYRIVPQVVHTDIAATFLSYVDHIDDSNRLTRATNVDTTPFLRELRDLAITETPSSSEPSSAPPVNREISHLFWNRVGYELASGNPSRASILDILDLLDQHRPSAPPPDRDGVVTQVVGARRRLQDAAAGSSLRNAISEFLAAPLLAATAAHDQARARQAHSSGSSSRRVRPETDPIIALAVDLSRLRTRAVAERSRPRSRRGLRVEVCLGAADVDRYETYEQRILEFFLRGFPLESPPTVSIQRGKGMRVTVREQTPHGMDDPEPPDLDPLLSIDLQTQYASSRLLRLWGDVFPNHGHLEMERSSALIDALRLYGQWETVRVYGTGPSAERLAQTKSRCAEGIGIACNSMVRQPDLLDSLNVRIVTAADPVFHAGPSDYACRFRQDLTDWLRRRSDNIFVTVGRDIHVYMRELPGDVHSQVISLPFAGARDDEPGSVSTIRHGRVRPHNNILTLLMLPLAATIGRRRIHLTGFDGAPPTETERYWHYSRTLNYDDELQQTVRDYHPDFFDHDLTVYRSSHSDMLAAMMHEVVASGIEVTLEHASMIPALRDLDERPDLHEGR